MEKEILRKYLLSAEESFDKKENMLFYKIEKEYNPAHSMLEKNVCAHSVINSLKYAMYILDYEEKYSKRADEIIKKVLSLQQSNPFREYYGLWSLFLEETLEQMSAPDMNSAVFNLKTLLHIYNTHKKHLPKNTLQMIESACFAASTCIVNRNTTLQYSHIVIQECYACVFCGELFSRLEFVNYGMQKLEKFLNFVLFNGDFFEFNSPVYSLLMAEDIMLIIDNIKNTRVTDAAKKLNKILWRGIAVHYHPTTGQLSGPFSRTHHDFLNNDAKVKLSNATGKNMSLSSWNLSHGISEKNIVSCPPQFYPFFTGKKNIEYSQRLIFHGSTYPSFSYSYTATTYSLPKYTLGSFNRHEFWEEHRPLIGYFGTENSPYCAKVTCLFDGVDFTSALLHCVQVKNSIIGHINFSTDRGIKHLNDKKNLNGIINVSDFRIRFTIIGNSKDLKTRYKNNKLSVSYRDLSINFNYNFYKFDTLSPYIEFTETNDCICFDLVLCSGKKTKISLADLECAICMFSLIFSDEKIDSIPVTNTLSDGFLTSVQQYENFELYLKTPVKPQSWIYLMINDSQKINGVKIEDYARDTEESALQYEFIVKSSSEIPMNISNDSSVPIDNILIRIENILSLNFNDIRTECTEILSVIRTSGISSDIAKRFAIRMITNIFEVAKSYSIIFENIIKYEYSNIYISLSQDNSIDAIEKTVISVLEKIKLDYQLYSENKKRKDFIDSVTDIIKQNFADPSMSLTYISEKLGMDVSHISKTFHKRTGISYLNYLTHVRMEHAKKLISDGETDAALIASQCGYENLSSFLRAFKRNTGNTVSFFIKKK